MTRPSFNSDVAWSRVDLERKPVAPDGQAGPDTVFSFSLIGDFAGGVFAGHDRTGNCRLDLAAVVVQVGAADDGREPRGVPTTASRRAVSIC